MRNIKTQNRFSLNPALFTLCLALLAGSGASALANAHHGKGSHPAVRRTCSHRLGNSGGLRCDWLSWIRRYF